MKKSGIKKIGILLSILLLTIFSFTGCDELATEILQEAVNAVVEEAYSEEDTYDEEDGYLEGDIYEDEEGYGREETNDQGNTRKDENPAHVTEEESAAQKEQVREDEEENNVNGNGEQSAVEQEDGTAEEEPERDPEPEAVQQNPEGTVPEGTVPDENGEYTTKDQVAAYLNAYGHLPSNFITKKEARDLGWVKEKGNLDEVAPGKSIGGDYFGNYEETLPEKRGREYHECDIDFDGKRRGAKRIVYSNDGLIYYTEDHYGTFELLYGEE